MASILSAHCRTFAVFTWQAAVALVDCLSRRLLGICWPVGLSLENRRWIYPPSPRHVPRFKWRTSPSFTRTAAGSTRSITGRRHPAKIRHDIAFIPVSERSGSSPDGHAFAICLQPRTDHSRRSDDRLQRDELL